jgi:signal transduction histidine kinase
MTIQDNGKGFDQNVVGNKQSLGLQNMTSRAAIINYELTIHSEIGTGTTITLSENQ